MITHYALATDLGRQRQQQMPADVAACRPLDPSRRRRLLTVLTGAVAAVALTAGGAVSAVARPEPEQATDPASNATMFRATHVPLLRSNVPDDAWTRERFVHSGRLDSSIAMIITPPEITAAEYHYEHRFGR